MLKYVYDLEVFPNFFSATFVNIDNDKEQLVFVIAPKRNDIDSFCKFLDQEMTLVGFNNLLYDGAVMHFITCAYQEDHKVKPKNLLPLVFDFSSNIINRNSFVYDENTRNHQKPVDVKYKQIDLMKLMAFDKLGVSLKQISINLMWHKVQDLPLPYDHYVKPEEYNIVLDYNLNDVLITLKLYNSLTSQLELRESLSEEYEVDLMSASDSKMADIILENIYCKEIGVQPKEVRNLKTERDSVRIADCLGKNIEFKTNILNRIKREIEEKIVHKEDNFKYGKTIKFANVTYELGVGGLHSVDQPAIFKADENMRIVDKDVASYYPSIMIVNNLYPEHLSPKFVDILKRITKERLKAKKSGNRIKADSLKIVVNSIFGKLGSDVYWLYDPKQLLSVTVSGQLYLLMLIESLVLEGIEVLSANTDGIVTRIPKHLENKCDEICKWWQNKTGFVLEDTEYVEYYRTDVNNYLVIKPDRKTKEKGRYLKNIDLKKAYRHPIVPKALYNYFVNKISIEETLHSSTDIFEFCISQKVGKDFILEYHANDGITKLQKNNRFYISNDGGKLIKKRIDSDKQIGLYVGENVTILNDYEDSILIDTRNINYEFYINEVNKYILEVEKNEGIEPFCFEDEPEGYISPEHLAEKEREVVINFLKGIKGIPDKLINDLTYINKHFINNKDFLELLVYCEDNSLMSSRFHDLILLGYFHEFGSSKKQMKIYEEFKKGKNRYTRTLSEKSKVKRLEELRLLFDFTSDDEYSILEKIKNEVSVTGNIRSVCNVDKRYAYVQDIDTKYTPKITVYPLSTGKQQVLKVFKKVFNAHPFAIGDILLCKEFKKRNSMRKNDAGEWEEVPDKFDWYLESYYVTKETDEFIVPS